MHLEKSPKTRAIVRHLLRLEDAISGLAFPNMTRAKQVTNAHCGPAVLASLYSVYGVKVNQKGIAASLRVQKKIQKFGLNMKDLAKAARIVGKGKFVFWKKSGATVRDLDLIINKYKTPVGVEWQGVFYENEDEDNGHYSIATKLDKKTGYIRLADPYSLFAGVDRKFKIKEFVERWWDENIIHGRTLVDNKVMFIITKKGENWPLKMGLKKN